MPEGSSKSKYALKVQSGKRAGPSNTRPRRVCSGCGATLSGRRGHGFVSRDGRGLLCGSCSGKQGKR